MAKRTFYFDGEGVGFNADNAPRFTAFATTAVRLEYQLNSEHRPMYAFYDNGIIVGYYSLLLQDNKECDINSYYLTGKEGKQRRE